MLSAFALLGALAEVVGVGAVLPFIALLQQPTAVPSQSWLRRLFEWSGAASMDEFVLWSALTLLGIFLAKNAMLALLYFQQFKFASQIEARLSSSLFAAYLEAPYIARLDGNSAHRLRIVTNEVSRVVSGVLIPTMALITEGAVSTAILILLVAVAPGPALLAFSIVAAASGSAYWFVHQGIDRYRNIRIAAIKGMFKWASAGLGALKELKVRRKEPYFIGAFLSEARSYASATSTFNTLNAMPRLAVETATVGVLLVATALGVADGKSMTDFVPLLALFAVAALRLLPSATRLMASINTLRFYQPSVSEVAAELARMRQHQAAFPSSSLASTGARPRRLESLALTGIRFAYPGAHSPAVQGVDLLIEPRKLTVIVGRSGSGKTTLADVLMGLLRPDAGAILLNGTPLDARQGEWGGLLGLVP
ncbi:MAG TPA: ABC transporter ATP-binding protein, partial [Candidatus Binataceae bacterium]|nr:ABC transporter ATP-binding protein [Candidatus Binataceae bacterium]